MSSETVATPSRGSDAEAAAQVLADHVDEHFVDDEFAAAAVAGIHAWASRKGNPIANIVAFVRSRSLEELERFARPLLGVDSPRVAARSPRAPRKTHPPARDDGPRCTTCGKVEPRCLTERPGLGDDHEFTAARSA